MNHISQLKPKEVAPYIGTNIEQLDKAIDILEKELNKLYLIKRGLITVNKNEFNPKDHGIGEYLSTIK